MPLSETLTQLVRDIAEATQGKSADEISTFIADTAGKLPQELREHVNRQGFKAGSERADAEKATLEREKTSLQQQITAKEAEVAKLREGNPDAEKVRQEYEQKLTEAENKRKADVLEVQNKLNASTLAAERDAVAAHLVSKGVDKLIAKYKAQELVDAGRIKVDTAGSVTVYGPDGATPISVAAGLSAGQTLGEEAIKSVDPTYIKSTTNAGPGGGNGSGGSDASGSDFDAIRNQVKNQVPAQDLAATEASLGIR